jgi:hypothetical protein
MLKTNMKEISEKMSCMKAGSRKQNICFSVVKVQGKGGEQLWQVLENTALTINNCMSPFETID